MYVFELLLKNCSPIGHLNLCTTLVCQNFYFCCWWLSYWSFFRGLFVIKTAFILTSSKNIKVIQHLGFVRLKCIMSSGWPETGDFHSENLNISDINEIKKIFCTKTKWRQEFKFYSRFVKQWKYLWIHSCKIKHWTLMGKLFTNGID